MKQSHTPGPWEVDRRKIGTLWNVDAENEQVALAIELSDDVKQKRRSANARLIATSPELLIACKAMYNAYQTSGKMWIGFNMLNPSEKKAYELLQGGIIVLEKVIAKAEKS